LYTIKPREIDARNIAATLSFWQTSENFSTAFYSNRTWHIRTVVSSSCNTWSYSLIPTQNMIAVTSSKQWIHFLRSDLWPPTSNNLRPRKKILQNVN